MRTLVGAVLSIWVGLALVGCDGAAQALSTPAPGSTPVITPTPVGVVCPSSLTTAIRAAASTYERAHPEAEIIVLPRANAMALSAIQRGDADIAILTWLSEALPDDAWIRPVSRDGLAVVVNPQNGLPGITMTQLQELFQGRLEDWALWGGLPGTPQLVSRETASGDYQFFQAWVMRDSRVSLNALLAPSPEAVLSFVAEDQLSIGYISTAWLDGRVRALAVNGVPPSSEAIEAGLYPMTRTHFVVTMAEPDGVPREFLQWLLAPPGLAVLEAHGFVAPPSS